MFARKDRFTFQKECQVREGERYFRGDESFSARCQRCKNELNTSSRGHPVHIDQWNQITFLLHLFMQACTFLFTKTTRKERGTSRFELKFTFPLLFMKSIQITPPQDQIKSPRATFILKEQSWEKQGETNLKQNLKIWISGLVTEYMWRALINPRTSNRNVFLQQVEIEKVK